MGGIWNSLLDETIAKQMPEGYIMRSLEKEDYHKGYLHLLSQLTTVGEISFDKFSERFDWIQSHPDVYVCVVIEELQTKTIVATGNIMIERKFIHECANCGHIEDIVVSDKMRGKGFGKYIIEQLTQIGKRIGCYKIILSCVQDKVGFYEKCGFKPKSVSMGLYLQ
ncbi:acetyltransferase [Gorgonomyces haynaldii]|nr:acetyltransferase [Gorgonomyces haynaldii]